MSKRIEFLYLNEQDTIDAGVLDAQMCVNNAEEVFRLLGEGDYLMGSATPECPWHGIDFPGGKRFPNMPLAGPDRRFFSMVAYLGGRFDVCGNKWYGSNAENKNKGLPRSVLTFTLNDKDTGEPICFMSANLLSAARTGCSTGGGGEAPGKRRCRNRGSNRLRCDKQSLLPFNRFTNAGIKEGCML